MCQMDWVTTIQMTPQALRALGVGMMGARRAQQGSCLAVVQRSLQAGQHSADGLLHEAARQHAAAPVGQAAQHPGRLLCQQGGRHRRCPGSFLWVHGARQKIPQAGILPAHEARA